MRLWQLTSALFFAYVALVGMWRGGRHPAARRALAVAAFGLLMVAVSSVADVRVLNEWVWPPLLLLIAYWSSGLLFVAPHQGQERALRWLDERWSIQEVGRRTPRALAEVFEAAYAGVYLLIPLALLVRTTYSAAPEPDTFWSVVLITDLVCFGVLPWVQTRPPRALEAGEPWPSSTRRFNLRLLGATSIQVNTFPSGHAAEGLAAFLLVLDAPVPVAAAMLLAAIAVSAGAVLGRYHYLADALAGWVVAVAVFSIVT
jgi:membrane-associated phospholipid phosphatase